MGESSPPNGSIPPFGRAKNAGKSRRFCSVKQKSVPFWRNHHSRTRLLCVLTQNSVKTVSLMGRTVKIAQNALIFAVWPITRKMESSQLAESLTKWPQNHRRIFNRRLNSSTPWGPKGVSFHEKRNVSQKTPREVSLPNRQQKQTVNSANCPDPKTTRGKGGFHPPLMVSS